MPPRRQRATPTKAAATPAKPDRKFLTLRARAGGAARARRYSRLWQRLLARFLTERRLKQTTVSTFREWLVSRGFADLAAAPLRQQATTAKRSVHAAK